MSKTKIKQIQGGNFEISNPDWQCSMTDGEGVNTVSLGVYVRVDEDSEYKEGSWFPYYVSCFIVPLPTSIKDKDVKVSANSNLEDIYNARGGIPIEVNDFKIINENSTGIEKASIGDRMTFPTQEDVKKWIENVLVLRFESVMLMSGFFLDLSIDQIMTTGWELLESIIFGDSFVERTLVKHSQKISNH